MAFVDFDHVWLAYDDALLRAGRFAVEDISLKMDEGEFIAIVGPSGCGKSTFMKLATGLRRPSRGTVVIDGREVAGPLKITGMAVPVVVRCCPGGRRSTTCCCRSRSSSRTGRASGRIGPSTSTRPSSC